MRVTDCECATAGWCERHRCEKTHLMRQLCRHDRALFQAWERGQGPGQQTGQAARRDHEPCQFRGEIIRQQACPSCRGEVRLHVFACQKHQECTVGTPLGSLACCATCPDFQPAVTSKTKGESACDAVSQFGS